MSAVPRLLAGPRRSLAALLAVLALGEAVAAVLFSAQLNHLLAAPKLDAGSLAGSGGIAAMAAGAMLLQRWVGERFAQGYVADCRTALFTAMARQRGATAPGTDARWLTVLINDLAALRNYALRGTVRLWTSTLAAGAAAAWAAVTMPQLRVGLIPLALGAAMIALLSRPLAHAVSDQRRERGRLNRFLVRRVHAELGDEPARGGHGFRKLEALSGDLANAAVRRAGHAGAMEAAATLAGLGAALSLALAWQASGQTSHAGIAGSLTLLGFIAARLLESARALHARIGGSIALKRLQQRLAAAALRPARKGTKRARRSPRPAGDPVPVPEEALP